MSTRAQVCAWIAAVGVAVPSMASAQDLTEREIVDLIVRDGPPALAIRAETEVVHREQLARLAYPNPAVTYAREGAGFTEFLQAEQSIPVFGARGALARAGAAATAAAEAERNARLWALRTDAAGAVATLAAAQAHLDAAQANARDIERLIEILRTREREGEGSRFDRLRAEQELRDARVRATSAAVDLGDARATLGAMLPRDVVVGRVAARTDLQLPPPPEVLTARALSARAELHALRQVATRADFEADAARRARLPVPSVFGGLKRADDEGGRARGGVFGLSVTLPLFDSGGRDAARWAAERARVDAELASIEQRIGAEVARASATLALRQSALAEDMESAADELIRIAEIGYREGEVGILELLDALRTAARARVRTIDLHRDLRLAQIALERAVGDLLWP